MKQCNERLADIRVPHDFSRTPRPLSQVKQWKGKCTSCDCSDFVAYLLYLLFFPASEHRSWVLYYSLPVLFGLLPDLYFTHYCQLVAAMHTLLGDCIILAAFN